MTVKLSRKERRAAADEKRKSIGTNIAWAMKDEMKKSGDPLRAVCAGEQRTRSLIARHPTEKGIIEGVAREIVAELTTRLMEAASPKGEVPS